MKNFILSCILYIVKLGMRFVYFFMKLFPTNKQKVTMLSRQSNSINIDFEMLMDEIETQYPDKEVKVLCKKIPKEFLKKIGYCFYMIKCLYHIATSKVCIIDGYIIPISSLKHKKGLIIVQIWHAMGAIKKFGKQVLDKNEGSSSFVAKVMEMHKNYTFITCTSQKTKQFYAEGFGTSDDKICVLGMPRIDYLLGKDGKIDKKVEKLKSDYPALKEKKNILYVPTFRKGQSIHIYDIIHAVDETKYNLIVQLHPLDETKVDSKYTVSNQYSTFELLKIADYVITDYSAVAFEACVLDKPLYFYLYDIEQYKENRGLNINILEEMKNNTYIDIQELVKHIENNQYDEEELKHFKQNYVETADTQNTKRIMEHIMELVEDGYAKK